MSNGLLSMEANVTSTQFDGSCESVYVVFREDTQANETIVFSAPDGIEVLIDVDERDIPIAVQVVESRTPEGVPNKTALTKREATICLFALSTQMVVYHRANQQRRGNALIKDALKDLGLLEDCGRAVPA